MAEIIDDIFKTRAKLVLARKSFWEYCRIKAPDFYTDDAEYLKEICDALQDFENDDTELLSINVPPRHGKSRTANLYAQWIMGRNPNLKMMIASYNRTLARQFSKAVRNDIGEIKADESRLVYSDVFPDAGIKRGSGTVDLWQLSNSSTPNFLATSPKSTATGFGSDIQLYDDMIKSAYESFHEGILEGLYTWFTDTMYSRLEGRRKIAITATRWNTKDLPGRIISKYREENRKIHIITKKAWDGKKMLNERVLNKEDYDKLERTIGAEIVAANYNQEPLDSNGNLYSGFHEYEPSELPKNLKIWGVCDTADTGTDYLCNIIFGLDAFKRCFVLDVYYTKDRMEITEIETARRLVQFEVSEYFPEANAGGRGFARAVENKCKEMGRYHTRFNPYSQTFNKQARILSMATEVMNRVFMPKGWDKRWAEFYRHMMNYQRTGNNLHDDAQDCITAVCEVVDNARGSVRISNNKIYR
ncbi:MAG: phage terminase large subunit [Defluviitaleaceae bacterium]|nr:phage terminase large subunit [Defluviitaleaceae bacterium]